MAHPKKRRSQNIQGSFYVDDTCIDCDTCRWVAPDFFHEDGGKSAVYSQPINPEQIFQASQALIACPTASIGRGDKSAIKEAAKSFPILIDEDVYYCGYASKDSFGAASYFIQRPEGNILIDSPRFAAQLVKAIKKMGGVRYLYLTHRDDVADHAQYQKYFSCERILHEDDIELSTREVEIIIQGQAPFSLANDLSIIPVPGHTKGHTVLLYKDKYLFAGDHLAYSARLKHLYAFHRSCWYSWSELTSSMKKLSAYAFEWVLPGHGRRFHTDKDQMRDEMKRCVAWMEGG